MKSKAMALHNCAENQKPGKQHFQTSPELGGSLGWGNCDRRLSSMARAHNFGILRAQNTNIRTPEH